MKTNKISIQNERKYRKIAIAAGAITLVGIGAYLFKNKQLRQDIFERFNDFKDKTAAKNQNTAAALITPKENLIYKNGILYNEDRTKYSGIRKIKTKLSNVFEINYKDGLPVESKKNGTLFKKWEYGLTSEAQSSKKITTTTYDTEGNLLKRSHSFIKDKLKRFIITDFKKQTVNAQDFSEEGKLLRKSEYFGFFNDNEVLETGELTKQIEFDDMGNPTTEINFLAENLYNVTKNGKTYTFLSNDGYLNLNLSTSEINLHEIKKPNLFERIVTKFIK